MTVVGSPTVVGTRLVGTVVGGSDGITTFEKLAMRRLPGQTMLTADTSFFSVEHKAFRAQTTVRPTTLVIFTIVGVDLQ